MWESLMQALVSGHKPLIAHAALTYVYYWYNFMPLARGTAVTGYITLLAIFLAADMPITCFIPKVCNCCYLVPKVGSSMPFIPLESVCLYALVMQYALQLQGMQVFLRHAMSRTKSLGQCLSCG